MEQESVVAPFTRRSFVKGASAVLAAGAVGMVCACSPQTSEEAEQELAQAGAETETFIGVCRGECAGGCPLKVHVRDGKVVRTSLQPLPDERYNRLCLRGLQQPARMYSANRLQYPMRRVEGAERGVGEFERISWEEAIDEIATKWKGYIDEFGNESLCLLQGGGQNGITSSAICIGSAGQRFMNVMGMTLLPLDVDHAYSRVGWITTSSTGGFNLPNEPADMLNAKTIVLWAGNPYINSPQIVHFINEAQLNGTKVIAIDPNFNTNACKADVWLPVRSATDGALAFGCINAILENGWEDKEFILAHSELPCYIKEDGKLLRMSDLGVEPTVTVDEATGAEVVDDPLAVWDETSGQAVAFGTTATPQLSGITEINGIKVVSTYDDMLERLKDYTPEKAAAITGLSVEQITELARVYAQEGPVYTYTMQGCNHYKNGHYNFAGMTLLGLITGNVAKPGASIGQGVSLPVACNLMEVMMPGFNAGTPIAPSPGEIPFNQVEEILDTGMYGTTPLNLKSVYITNANVVSGSCGYDSIDRWLKKFDFVVVADMEMTDTAKYADILLPVSHWFEIDELYGSYATHGHLTYQSQIVEPLYESIPDFEIYRKITKALGDEYYQYFDMDNNGFIELWLDTDAFREMGLTWDFFKENHIGNFWNTEGDGELGIRDDVVFRVYQEEVPQPDNTDWNGVCAVPGMTWDESVPEYTTDRSIVFWKEPGEANPADPCREKYPYQMMHERLRTRLHQQFWTSKYNEDYEPGPLVRIRPDDAASHGVAEGDLVEVFNDRGSVTLPVTIDPGLSEGIIVAPRGFENFEFIAGEWSSLASQEYNAVNENHCFQDCAVDFKKVEA
ncbi:molybdopterin-dependent oxidoreductase [Adlercreutzia sp. R7]|uniref:Molybdopterin-dependent oxidoreductase n=1 Tax=Adlercreutzia wanghongyangiae TaxID=3111451 RepID=A0ABU6IGQ1_9ACTN|nr:molybdopterin-dependent oxidoreductase [Adlercreutzia sp. R7]